MKGVILVELLLALDRFILHFQLKAHSPKKMFQTTSSNLILIMLYEIKFQFRIMGVQLFIWCACFVDFQEFRARAGCKDSLPTKAYVWIRNFHVSRDCEANSYKGKSSFRLRCSCSS